MMPVHSRVALFSLLTLSVLAGCGSGHGPSGSGSSTPSTAAGDIADTATYLTYHGSGYSLKYVEGWGIQQGPGGHVAISDKDSSETVAVRADHQTVAAVATSDLAHLRSTAPRFHLIARRTVQLPAGTAAYAQYRTLSAPDPVTSKRVAVVVDRYYVQSPNRVAVLTLSTPVGVDNVDAFRLIARSFRWR